MTAEIRLCAIAWFAYSQSAIAADTQWFLAKVSAAECLVDMAFRANHAKDGGFDRMDLHGHRLYGEPVWLSIPISLSIDDQQQCLAC